MLITLPLEPDRGLCQISGMAKRNARAGGFFLTAAILGGLIWGIAAGNLMAGILVGTALGVVAAALLWLIDRRG